MTTPPISLTVEAGGRSRTMSEAGMAILLGLKTADLRRRLTWYLGLPVTPAPLESSSEQSTSSTRPPGEGGKGGMGYVNGDVEREVKKDVNHNVNENIHSNAHDTDGTFLNVTFGEGEDLQEETSSKIVSLAGCLARTLSDPSSLHCYERLVTQHPAERLERALELTLNVPLERLKKSRAAYFMGVVRTLARNASVN